MATVGTLTAVLEANTSSFNRGLTQATSRMQSFANTVTRASKFAAAGLAAVAGAATLVVRAASKQREAELRLEAAIRGTGQAIDVEKIKRYAAQLQKLTTFGDEATIESAALLTTFQLTEDQIIGLLPRVQNLSAMYGMDLRQSALQVGRALTMGAGALSRYGIILTDAEKRAFNMADQTGKVALLMKILDKNTGDAAQTLSRTATGAFTQFRNAVGDLQEQLGFLIDTDVGDFFRDMTKRVQAGTEWLSRLDDTTKRQIVTIGKFATGLLAVVAGLGLIGMVVPAVISGLTLLAGVFGLLLSPAFLVIAALVAGALALKTAWDENLGRIQDKAAAVWDVLEPIYSAAKEKLSAAWDFTVNLLGDAAAWVRDTAIPWLKEHTGAALSTAWEWTVTGLGTAWAWVKDTALPWLKEHTGPAIQTAWDWVFNASGAAWDWIKNISSSGIVELGKAQLQLIVEPFGALYDAIKNGLETGDWSGIWGVAADAWRAGMKLAVSLYLVAGTVRAILSGITTGLALGRAGLASLGMPGVIGALSIAISLMEAREGGDYKAFGANLIAALAAGIGIGAFTGSPAAGALAFTVVLNFQVGSWIGDKLEQLRELVGDLPPTWRLSISEPRNVELRRELGFQAGGLLPGLSGPDQFPALLAPGEAVVPSRIVQGGWPAVLDWFRSMGVPGFQGGLAPAAITAATRTTGLDVGSIARMVDSISAGFTKVFQSIQSGIGALFSFILSAIESIAPKILGEEAYASLRETIIRLRAQADGLMFAMGGGQSSAMGLGDEMESLKTRIQEAQQTAREQDTWWKRITASLGALWQQGLARLQPIVDALASGFQQFVANPLKATGDALMWLAQQTFSLGQTAFAFARDAFLGIRRDESGEVTGSALGDLAAQAQATVGSMIGMMNPLNMFGAILDALNPAMAFMQRIVEALAPIFEVLFYPIMLVAEALASALAPVLKALFPVFRLLGLAVLKVARLFMGAWNAIAGVINKLLGWLGVNLPTFDLKPIDEAISTLTNLTWDEVEARLKERDAIEQTTNALRNVPQGFKLALRRFQLAVPGFAHGGIVMGPTLAMVGEGGPEAIVPLDEAGGGTTIIIEGDVYGWDDFKRKVAEAEGENKRTRSLSRYGA